MGRLVTSLIQATAKLGDNEYDLRNQAWVQFCKAVQKQAEVGFPLI